MANRSLLAAALEATHEPEIPNARDQLISCGHDAKYVMNLDDDGMWALHRKEFGGVRWKQMAALHELDPNATTDWFRANKLSQKRADAMLKHMKRKAEDDTDSEVDTPEKRQKT